MSECADNDITMKAMSIIDNKITPPLKWAGGKRWLVSHIKPLWLKYSNSRYVEPLCGGIAIALGLMPSTVLLNDINPHPVNFYNWLKRGLKITLPMENTKDTYYQHRQRFNELISNGKMDSKEAVSLFYYLNRTCYNGLCRFNNKGEFNVPFGKYSKISYTTDFTKYKAIFKTWEFTIGDFEDIKLKKNDFIYADPPYDVEFTKYSKEDFKWDDQIRLAEWLSKHKGVVVLSNQATKRIVKLYKTLGFIIKYVDAPRMISCNGDRTPAKEVVAIKGI